MNPHSDVIARLQLYNERAVKLGESTFLKQVLAGHPVFHLHGGPFHAIRKGEPDPEAMEAFLLTFRLFLQDRDGLSFRKIGQLYEELPISGSLKGEVEVIRTDLNHYLDGPSPFVIFGKTTKRRELLMTWLYGELAHLNPEHRTRLREWRVDDGTRPLFQHEFEGIVTHVTQAVFWIRQVNVRAIAELQNGRAGPGIPVANA